MPVMMQGEYLFIVGWNTNLYNHYGNHCGIASGNQELIYIKIQLFILWHIPKEPYILPERTCSFMSIFALLIIARNWKQPYFYQIMIA